MSSNANKNNHDQGRRLRSIFVLLLIVQWQPMTALVSPDHHRYHQGAGLSRSSVNVNNVFRVTTTEISNRRITRTVLSASSKDNKSSDNILTELSKVAAVGLLSVSMLFNFNNAAFAEDELAAKYGGKGFDSSLVDQTCLVNKCSLQSKACLADDPSCRKGLTCTAKCMGDNACITGCMARYGNENLDNLLKCTIEDNECIKVAILDGGADEYGSEPRPPAPTVARFDMKSMEGSWYKVVGFNPNYDCYACQKNTFTSSEQDNANLFSTNNKLQVDVQFSMPRLLPDGSPPPPSNVRERVSNRDTDNLMYGSQSIGLNEYATHETMVFDSPADPVSNLYNLVLGKQTDNQKTYSRTAHSEGEMFGLKFWENWYVIGENDPNEPEFKFIYYNGKTRQNTYEGAFVYSRTRDLDPISMKKVYQIASDAGMNPNQFCKIRNGCFASEPTSTQVNAPTNPVFRKIMASTRISELLGVEPVSAEPSSLIQRAGVSSTLTNTDNSKKENEAKRAWWYEVGDYLEDPHRHFKAMDSLRLTVDWPENVLEQTK